MTQHAGTESVSNGHGWRRTLLDVVALLLLVAALYLPGLDTHGVTNWQEAQRLVVAREMQARWEAGEGIAALIVPTVHGRPYLAKPPLVYWAQLALAQPFGARVELWHLRLAVALGGMAGVIAAYAAARSLIGWRGARSRSIGLWSAALLATGILPTRSARIGELDVFLMPLVAAAIACIATAWRSHRAHRRTCWAAVIGAAAFTTLGTLTKDPAVMVVGFGGYLGILLHSARTRDRLDVSLVRGRGSAVLVEPPAQPSPPVRAAQAILTIAAAIAGGVAAGRQAVSLEDWLGTGLIALGCGAAVQAVAPVLQPLRMRAFITALSRTHPVIVLGVAAAVRVAWGAWVNALVGRDAAGELAKVEAEDNLRLFVPDAPINNLEAMTYGVGLGSLALIGVIIWLLRTGRGRGLTPGAAQLAAWIGFGLLAFSVLGKGVPRYLTPIWPAVAIAGAWGVVAMLANARGISARTLRFGLIIAIAGLGIGQTVWYGWGRETREAARSPRAMIAELLPRLEDAERRRIYTHEFATPAIEYYVDAFGPGRVRVLGDPRVNITMAGGKPVAAETLYRWLSGWKHSPRTAIVLLREQPTGDLPREPAIERLRSSGISVEPIDVDSEFRIDSGRTRVLAVRVCAPQRSPESPDEGDDDSP